MTRGTYNMQVPIQSQTWIFLLLQIDHLPTIVQEQADTLKAK